MVRLVESGSVPGISFSQMILIAGSENEEMKRMTITITVSEEVVRRLNDLSIAQTDDVETKLQRLLVAEYQRRLARYRLTDRRLSQKYGMAFEEFERRQVTRQQEYSWEVESDAIAWETAIDGIQTMQQQLTGIHELKNRHYPH